MWLNLLVSLVASIIVSYAIRRKIRAPKQKPAELQFPTAEQGRPIPVVFGTCEVKSPNVVWVGDKSTASYVNNGGGVFYYAGMHMVICHGVCDYLREIYADGKVIDTDIPLNSGLFANDEIYADSVNLFGGKSSEGGIRGYIDVLFGAPAQTQNAYLQGILGTDIPAFRGVMSVVLKQLYLGNSQYIRPWSFLVQRILKDSNGDAQWYAAKAQVNTTYELAVPDLAKPATETTADVIYSLSHLQTYVIKKPAGLTYQAWSPDGGTTWKNEFKVYVGSTLFGSTTYWSGSYASAALAEAAFEDEIIVISKGFSAANIYIDITEASGSRANNTGGLSLEIYSTHQNDMNPVHIVREMLTDPVYGMNVDAADIDADSFEAAADTCYNEGMGLSLVRDVRGAVDDAVQDVLSHCGAVLFTDISTGKYKIRMIRDDYDVNTLLTLDDSNIMRVAKASRPTFSELTNSVTVNYWDYKARAVKTVNAQDHAMVSAMGAVVDEKVDYLSFSNGDIAARAALRDLKTLSTPLLTVALECTREAAVLEPGDVFILNIESFSGLLMRIQRITYGDGMTGMVKIDAVQDSFSMTTYGVVIEQLEPDFVQPLDVVDAVVEESPYWFLAERYGQATANALLGGTPTYGAVFASAANPGDQDGIIITEDEDDTGTLTFCAYAELDGHVTDRLATTIEITNWSSGIGLVEVGSLAYLDGEWLRIDAVDTGTDSCITVGRGCLDTYPTTHSDSNGGVVLFVGGAYTVTDSEYVATNAPVVELLTQVDGATLSAADATDYTVTMASRAVRPYPPGNVTIEGQYWPDDLTGLGSITIEWAHRNRQSLTINDFADTDNGPEAGTTYTVQLYDADSASEAWYEATGITGTTHSIDFAVDVPPTGILNLKTVLTAVRGGYESWESFECTSVFEEPVTLAEVQALTGVYDIWVPSETTSLYTTDVSGTNASVNGTVGRMQSLVSGSTRHFVQATSGNRPTLRQSGAQYYLEFDGVNDFIWVTASTALYKFMHDDTDGYALVAVSFGNSSNPNVQYFALSTDGGASASIGFSMKYNDISASSRNNAFVTNSSRGVGGQYNYLTATNDAITPQVAHVIEYGVGTGSSIQIVDGATVATGTELYTESPASASYSLHAGFSPGGSTYSVMNLYGIVMFDQTPSAGDLLIARKYLAQRCGVEL
jgi:hypothetical protein